MTTHWLILPFNWKNVNVRYIVKYFIAVYVGQVEQPK